MNAYDFTDFYILYKGHPRWDKKKLIEDEPIQVIIQKYEMILFTNKGEVYGDPDIGADLLHLLHSTKVSGDYVKDIINEQILKYIPELLNTDYTLQVTFMQDPENYQDMMFINMEVSDYSIIATIS